MHRFWLILPLLLTSTLAQASAPAPPAAPDALKPSKLWFAPDQPMNIDVKPGGEAQLVLADFSGRPQEAKGPVDFAADKSVDLREVFQDVSITPGTYVLFLVKKAATKDLEMAPADFIGTPLVISAREDTRPGAPSGVMVTHIEPLRYAVIHMAAGPVTVAFYYDVAPNTADNFLRLASQGFYDGLTFHRIIPGFVMQGGDPRGDGTGSAGYRIGSEFSIKPHKEGVLSMARDEDPAERNGEAMPRPQFANSASSQFFICLDYAKTAALDKKYTAFGEVVSGMEAVKKIAATPLADDVTGRPKERQVMEKVEVKPVTAAENPYAGMFKPKGEQLGEPVRAGKRK
jgi:peptidyl-prolyl cis-trans isomerase B (cyclophilin B)